MAKNVRVSKSLLKVEMSAEELVKSSLGKIPPPLPPVAMDSDESNAQVVQRLTTLELGQASLVHAVDRIASRLESIDRKLSAGTRSGMARVEVESPETDCGGVNHSCVNTVLF